MKNLSILISILIITFFSPAAFAEESICFLNVNGNMDCYSSDNSNMPVQDENTILINVDLNVVNSQSTDDSSFTQFSMSGGSCSKENGGRVQDDNGVWRTIIYCIDGCDDNSVCDEATCTTCVPLEDGVIKEDEACGFINQNKYNKMCYEINCPPGESCEQTRCLFCMKDTVQCEWGNELDQWGERQKYCAQNCPYGMHCDEKCKECVEDE